MSAGPAGTVSSLGDRGRLQSLAPIVIFDVGGPLVTYYSLRSAGLSTVAALILSGVLPAFGIALGVARRRRLDAIGSLVLTGIVVGTALGLASGSAHVVLLDGTVPTAVFGAVCIGSLWSTRPLIYRFALEGMGPDTPAGRNFAGRWRYPGFRHAFRVTTMVWGIAFLAEAVAQVFIVQTTSTATAKASSNVMPLVVAGVVIIWNISYAKRGQRKGELAERGARGEASRPLAAGSE